MHDIQMATSGYGILILGNIWQVPNRDYLVREKFVAPNYGYQKENAVYVKDDLP
jgi:hypothetical protein